MTLAIWLLLITFDQISRSVEVLVRPPNGGVCVVVNNEKGGRHESCWNQTQADPPVRSRLYRLHDSGVWEVSVHTAEGLLTSTRFFGIDTRAKP
jgi:hypothetical protein